MGAKKKWTKVGYARVSTIDQQPDYQIKVLEASGCERIFVDHRCGTSHHRPEFERAVRSIQRGGVLTVWKIDRLGRSLRHLIEILYDLQDRSIELRSLTEQIDTRTPLGRAFFHVSGAFAEYESRLIAERTREAIGAARAKRKQWGRPSKFHDPKFREMVRTLLENPELSVAEVAKQLGVCKSVLYRWCPQGNAKYLGGDGRPFRQPTQKDTTL